MKSLLEEIKAMHKTIRFSNKVLMMVNIVNILTIAVLIIALFTMSGCTMEEPEELYTQDECINKTVPLCHKVCKEKVLEVLNDQEFREEYCEGIVEDVVVI